VAKQKKTSAAEYKPVRNGGSGRPNYGIIMYTDFVDQLSKKRTG